MYVWCMSGLKVLMYEFHQVIIIIAFFTEKLEYPSYEYNLLNWRPENLFPYFINDQGRQYFFFMDRIS